LPILSIYAASVGNFLPTYRESLSFASSSVKDYSPLTMRQKR